MTEHLLGSSNISRWEGDLDSLLPTGVGQQMGSGGRVQKSKKAQRRTGSLSSRQQRLNTEKRPTHTEPKRGAEEVALTRPLLSQSSILTVPPPPQESPEKGFFTEMPNAIAKSCLPGCKEQASPGCRSRKTGCQRKAQGVLGTPGQPVAPLIHGTQIITLLLLGYVLVDSSFSFYVPLSVIFAWSEKIFLIRSV